MAWCVMSRVLSHGIPVWQHIGQSTIATSWHLCDYDLRCLKATLNPNKQISIFSMLRCYASSMELSVMGLGKLCVLSVLMLLINRFETCSEVAI